ncbi:hypothetical protein [Saccharothrix lopnurensis]|uniref:Uncharacterized protein n=1 Tax=Saccharothrix lopnurensis TaxID=1670621 RepID=A0ABW1PGZ8_9PSEU
MGDFADAVEVLGVSGHPGGLVVRRPELSIGVVRVVSRPSGLEVEVLARQPLDRRDATRRQREVREGRVVPPAPRVLLPQHDEGLELRLGVLGDDGRARWAWPVRESDWTGDHHTGEFGPEHHRTFLLPPAFDEVSLVFAWPGIGFPETVVTLPLPDRGTVERDARPIWDAPVAAVPTTTGLADREARHVGAVAVETGVTAAAPRVLHRGGHAAVVLTRLAAVEPGLLAAYVVGVAGDVAGGRVVDDLTAPRGKPSPDLTARWGESPSDLTAPDGSRPDLPWSSRGGPGPGLAVVRGAEAFWLSPHSAETAGGSGRVVTDSRYVFDAPTGGVLDLLVTWPAAGLPDAVARIPLTPPVDAER